jgi:tetratricopeptide (TPR) repeat protein
LSTDALAESADAATAPVGDGAVERPLEPGEEDDIEGEADERALGLEAPPMSRRSSMPPTSLPHERSFLRVDEALPRVIVSDRPPATPSTPPVDDTGDRASPVPEAATGSSPAQAETLPERSSPVPESPRPSPVPAPAPASPPVATPAAVASSLPPASPSAHPPPQAAVAPSSPPESRGAPPSSTASPRASVVEHLEAGAKLARDEPEGALREYKAALGMLSTSDKADRADIFVRIADIKTRQDKRREAISNFEKALSYTPGNRQALEALVDLNVHERDWRAVQGAEERLLGTLDTEDERFDRLVQFGDRWGGVAEDEERARRSYERARDIHPDDVGVLDKLRRLYETANEIEQAITTRRRIAELSSDPRARARQYYQLGQYIAFDLRREDEGLELFDQALEADPSMLEPLEVVATLLAERMDYAELERAYRRMLERIQRVPRGAVRTEVTWELCRRLGLLFRDHLEDPSLALEAFEDAVEQKPNDVASHLSAAEMARLVHRLDRAALHLQAVATLEPTRLHTFHDLFDVFQKLRAPDQAFSAACVTMHHRAAETRERFIFEEHRIDGVPKLARAVRKETWELLRVDERDRALEDILGAIAPCAITMRLAQLAEEGRVPALDPASKQDPDTSTASIVRSFKWAAHFLSLPLPAIYVRDEPNLNLAAVPVEQPTVIAGGGVLRGKSLSELAFLVGRHLSYYLPPHRLLLYYSSLEELSALFMAAVKVVLPAVPMPKPLQEAAAPLLEELDARLGADARVELTRAVQAFEASGTPADLARWVGDVERCATRTGLLLCGDLDVAVAVVNADPRGVVAAEDKAGDLCGFIVSDAYFDLRRELGIAIEP